MLAVKTIVISIPLLILLVACGKTPDDPGRPGKNVVPRMAAPSAAADRAELFGEAPEPARRHSPSRSM